MKTRSLIVASLMVSVALPVGQGAIAQSLALEEIVVTARKRDESIYEIPISVSALSQAQIDRLGISSPDDLSDYIPGLDFQGTTATGGRFNPDIRFRGMKQQIITPATQVGALFWDGSYIGAGGAFLPLGDLERVEVIKGPQTAQYGRNTFSGAVNYIPKLPGDEWEGDISLEMSPSDGTSYNINGGIGGPINDKVGVRVWVGHQDTGGDFFTQDGERYGWAKDTTISSTMTMDPMDDLSLKLTGYFVNATTSGQYGGIDPRVAGSGGTAAGACGRTYNGEYLNPATGERTPFARDLSTLSFASWCGNYPNGKTIVGPVTIRPVAGQSSFGDSRLAMMSNLAPFMEKYGILKQPKGRMGDFDRSYRLQFSGEYDLGDHSVSFQASRSNTGLVTVRSFEYGIPRNPGKVLLTGTNIAIRETYFEARLSSPQDGRLRYMVGVSDYTQRYRVGRSPKSTQLSGAIGTLPSPVDFQDNTTFGIFGSIDYDLTEDLTLSAEARLSDEESIGIVQGNPNNGCSFSPTCNLIDSNKDFIPRVILSYNGMEGATIYGSYSYSSLLGVQTQAGFVNSVAPEIIPSNQLDALGLFTPPQENEQFELGWKQQLDNWAFTAAIFMMDWKNQPFASVILLPTGGTTSFRGPGDSKYKGLDFEINGNPTEWLSITTTLAYTDAKLVSYSSRGSNEFSVLGSGPLSVVNDGNEPRNTPRWSASFSPTILGTVGDRDWFIRTDVLYESKTWADYSEYNRTPDSLRINLRAGIDVNENFNLEFYGRNITHDKTLPPTNGTTSGPGGVRKAFTALYKKPEFGIRVNADF